MIDSESTPEPGTVAPDNAIVGPCGTASVWIYNASYTDGNGRRRYLAEVYMGIDLNYLMTRVDWTTTVTGEPFALTGVAYINPPDTTWNHHYLLTVGPGRYTVTARYVATKYGGGRCESASGLTDSVTIS